MSISNDQKQHAKALAGKQGCDVAIATSSLTLSAADFNEMLAFLAPHAKEVQDYLHSNAGAIFKALGIAAVVTTGVGVAQFVVTPAAGYSPSYPRLDIAITLPTDDIYFAVKVDRERERKIQRGLSDFLREEFSVAIGNVTFLKPTKSGDTA
jgi:hypothetical protein